MVKIINISEFRNNIGSYIDKIVFHKEAFVLTKGNKIVAKVIAAQDTDVRKKTTASPFLKLEGLWTDTDREQFEHGRQRIDRQDSKDKLPYSK